MKSNILQDESVDAWRFLLILNGFSSLQPSTSSMPDIADERQQQQRQEIIVRDRVPTIPNNGGRRTRCTRRHIRAQNVISVWHFLLIFILTNCAWRQLFGTQAIELLNFSHEAAGRQRKRKKPTRLRPNCLFANENTARMLQRCVASPNSSTKAFLPYTMRSVSAALYMTIKG